MQGSSPTHGSTSPPKQDTATWRVQSAHRSNGGTTGPVLRTSPKRKHQYYTTIATPRSAQDQSFGVNSSGSVSPHLVSSTIKHNLYGEDGNSPPPDDDGSSFQPQGTTTAAAFNSPLLHSTKFAQKRFNAGTLYSETDQPFYEDGEGDRTPTLGSGRTSVTSFKPLVQSRLRPIPPINGYTSALHSTSSYRQDGRTNSIPRYTLIQRGFRLLPARIQRLFKKRKKKLLSPEITFEKHERPSQTYVPRILVLGLLVLVYMIYRYSFGARTSSQVISDKLESPTSVQNLEKPPLPTRKWWQALEQTPSTKPVRRVKKDPTSFAKPYHSLDELLRLPSRYKIPSSISDPALPLDVPSNTVIIDCINTSGPLYSSQKQALDAMLAALHSEDIKPSSIRLLLSSVDFPTYNPQLFGYEKGTTRIYTMSSSVETFLSAPAFNEIDTDRAILLECPSPHDGELTTTTDYITTLLRIAGTEEYSNKLLSTSGLARRLEGTAEVAGWTVYASTGEPVHDDSDSTLFRKLEESRPVDLPMGNLLFNPAWLDALRAQVDGQSKIHQQTSYKATTIPEALAHQLRLNLGIDAWALPIPVPQAYSAEDPLLHMLNLAKTLPDDFMQSELSKTSDAAADQGSAAKVAIFLPSSQGDAISLWESMICGFAEDGIYEHQVKVFLPASGFSNDLFIPSCPEVQLQALETRAAEDYKPDICLSTIEADLGVFVNIAAASCVHVNVPEAEVTHLDWMPALPVESLRNWHVPKIDLAVVTNNRPLSLHRLLKSLRSAHYLGDHVNMFINLEQTSDDDTRKILEDSVWPYGQISLRHRVVMGGLMASIVESWYPANNDTYGVLLEDDVEVSPLFYSWLKFTILQYRYGTSTSRLRSQRMYGISLYQPKNIELRPEGRRKFDARKMFEDMGIPSTVPYLSQIPCSWGAVYFPEHWREFHQFLSIRLSETAMDLSDPIVPNIRSNRWLNSWKKYIIELVYLKGYTMLYPNYEDFRSLSTNHLEQGTHVKDATEASKRRDLFEVPLMKSDDSIVQELPDGRLPSWIGLPIVDFWGSIVNEREIVGRGIATFEELDLCPEPQGGGMGISTETSGGIGEGHLEKVLARPDKPDHDASRLICAGKMDARDWKEWRMRLQHGSANDIDAMLLLEREAKVTERERKLDELGMKLQLQLAAAGVADDYVQEE